MNFVLLLQRKKRKSRGKKQARKEQSSEQSGNESLSFASGKESAAAVLQNSPSVRSQHDQEGQSGDESSSSDKGVSVPPPTPSVSARSQRKRDWQASVTKNSAEAGLLVCTQIIEALIADRVP
jgi:hypothetical protein